MTNKNKVTKKEIKNLYGEQNIYSIPYCNLQFLLTYEEPFAYSTRIEGWACDYYSINRIILSTGYSPIGQHTPYTLTRNYNKLARIIIDDPMTTDEEKENRINNLLENFVNELTK